MDSSNALLKTLRPVACWAKYKESLFFQTPFFGWSPIFRDIFSAKKFENYADFFSK